MTTGAIVMRWGNPVRGREAKALDVLMRSHQYLDELAKEGRIHDHSDYFAMTGKVGGFGLVNGQLEELQAIQNEEAFRKLMLEASTIVENFEIILYSGGSEQAVGELITTYVTTLGELGYLEN